MDDTFVVSNTSYYFIAVFPHLRQSTSRVTRKWSQRRTGQYFPGVGSADERGEILGSPGQLLQGLQLSPDARATLPPLGPRQTDFPAAHGRARPLRKS